MWIFGWNRLPRLVHLACIWIVAIAVNVSAFFIISANSFMQHPVGAHYNPETQRAELNSILALLTNNTGLTAFSHTVTGALLTAGNVRRRRQRVVAGPVADHHRRPRTRAMYRPATALGCWVVLLATVGLFFTGDHQGKLMFQQQPMKMASAESLCDTQTDPDFSILTVGRQNNCDALTRVIEVPYVLPFLAEGKFEGVTLQGVRDIQQDYEQRFGPNDYRPNLFVTYWSFRMMIGLLAIPVLFALLALWLTRGGRIPNQRWFARFALLTIPTPFLANSAGWVFTEMGRQPWIVAPNPTGDQTGSTSPSQPASRTTPRPGRHLAGHLHAGLRGPRGHLVLAAQALHRRRPTGTRRRTGRAAADDQDSDEDQVAPLSFAY